MGVSYVLTFFIYTAVCGAFGFVLCKFIQMVKEKKKMPREVKKHEEGK